MNSDEKIRVLKIAIGQQPQVVEVGNDLHDLQIAVGGDGTYHATIEYLWSRDDRNACILMDENGRLRKLPYNRHAFGLPIVGDFYVVGIKRQGGSSEEASLTEEQIATYTKMFAL